MRNCILYIAISLDGYIADRDGRVDWLTDSGNGEGDESYSRFLEQVDTIVMGWNTYHQIVSELSPGQWPYCGMTCYVITHRALSSTDSIRFVNCRPCKLIRSLKTRAGRGIWICGGAQIVAPLLASGAIDRYHISVIPMILGGGIPLFPAGTPQIPLRLLRAESHCGITELVYLPRNPAPQTEPDRANTSPNTAKCTG